MVGCSIKSCFLGIAVMLTPVAIAQGQLDAYNAHDIDSFCTYFSDDVIVIDGHDDTIILSGKKDFRDRYTQTFSNEALHCTLVSRMALGNIVIDKESVVGLGEDIVEAIAVYHIQDVKIKKVVFY